MHQICRCLRLRYSRAKVKRVLNRKIYPTIAPAPIQYQFDLVKIPRDSRTSIPNGLDSLSGICIAEEKKIEMIFQHKGDGDIFSIARSLHDSNFSRKIHSQKSHSVHTSKVRTNNPRPTISLYPLQQRERNKNQLVFLVA